MKINYSKLKNHLLIAMPSIEDPLFEQSVCLICQHGKTGTVGFVINKQIVSTESDLLIDYGFKIKSKDFQRHLLIGGPVHKDRGFVIHQTKQKWPNSTKVSPTLSITTSKKILEAIATKKITENYMICLGYATWEPEQLENELKYDWLVSPSSDELLFDVPFENRWEYALQKLGINPHQLKHTTHV